MTTQSLPQLRRIQVLLNTLVGEHHVRRSLLREICDLLGLAGRGLTEAHDAALELLASLDGEAEVQDFDGSVQRISRVVDSSPEEVKGIGDRHTLGA
jgi:hypothetical protein